MTDPVVNGKTRAAPESGFLYDEETDLQLALKASAELAAVESAAPAAITPVPAAGTTASSGGSTGPTEKRIIKVKRSGTAGTAGGTTSGPNSGGGGGGGGGTGSGSGTGAAAGDWKGPTPASVVAVAAPPPLDPSVVVGDIISQLNTRIEYLQSSIAAVDTSYADAVTDINRRFQSMATALEARHKLMLAAARLALTKKREPALNAVSLLTECRTTAIATQTEIDKSKSNSAGHSASETKHQSTPAPAPASPAVASLAPKLPPAFVAEQPVAALQQTVALTLSSIAKVPHPSPFVVDFNGSALRDGLNASCVLASQLGPPLNLSCKVKGPVLDLSWVAPAVHAPLSGLRADSKDAVVAAKARLTAEKIAAGAEFTSGSAADAPSIKVHQLQFRLARAQTGDSKRDAELMNATAGQVITRYSDTNRMELTGLYPNCTYAVRLRSSTNSSDLPTTEKTTEKPPASTAAAPDKPAASAAAAPKPASTPAPATTPATVPVTPSVTAPAASLLTPVSTAGAAAAATVFAKPVVASASAAASNSDSANTPALDRTASIGGDDKSVEVSSGFGAWTVWTNLLATPPLRIPYLTVDGSRPSSTADGKVVAAAASGTGLRADSVALNWADTYVPSAVTTGPADQYFGVADRENVPKQSTSTNAAVDEHIVYSVYMNDQPTPVYRGTAVDAIIFDLRSSTTYSFRLVATHTMTGATTKMPRTRVNAVMVLKREMVDILLPELIPIIASYLPLGFLYDPTRKDTALLLSNGDRTLTTPLHGNGWCCSGTQTFFTSGVHIVRYRIDANGSIAQPSALTGDRASDDGWVSPKPIVHKPIAIELAFITREFKGWSGYIEARLNSRSFCSDNGSAQFFGAGPAERKIDTYHAGDVVEAKLDMTASTLHYRVIPGTFYQPERPVTPWTLLFHQLPPEVSPAVVLSAKNGALNTSVTLLES